MQKPLTNVKRPLYTKLALRLLVVAILVEVLLLTPASRATNRFSCYLGNIGGVTRTLSCGSSAGNFVMVCSGGSGCVDETGNSDINQAIANQLCVQYASEGCPEPLGGEPPPDTVILTQ